MKRSVILAVIGVVLVSRGLRAVPVPATRPVSRPATTRAVAAASTQTTASKAVVRDAIFALRRESAAALHKHAALPRTEADFFVGKDLEIVPDDILDAIGRPIDADPRIDAYVKWQLLSAVERFEVSKTVALINAFVNAPRLIALPGMSDSERQPWTARLRGTAERDVDRLNAEWSRQTQPIIDVDAMMIRYREALLARITMTDAFRARMLRARLEDCSERAAAGLDIGTAFDVLCTDIDAWSKTATPPEARSMAGLATEYAMGMPSDVYIKLEWSAEQRQPVWTTRKAELDPAKLKEMIALLDAVAHGKPVSPRTR